MRERGEAPIDSNHPPIHAEFRLLGYQVLDGLSVDGNRARLEEHLNNCQACQTWFDELVEVERNLAAYLTVSWQNMSLSATDLEGVAADVLMRVGKDRVGRRLSVSIKQLGIIGLIILSVLGVLWLIDRLVPVSRQADQRSEDAVALATPPITQVPTPRVYQIDPSLRRQAIFNGGVYIDFNVMTVFSQPRLRKADARRNGADNLLMLLQFWGWSKGLPGQIEPGNSDRFLVLQNVVDAIEKDTQLKADLRVGGEIDTLKRLLTSGYPVLVEIGGWGYGTDGWDGRYIIVNGFNDRDQVIHVLNTESFNGYDTTIDYETFLLLWQPFNYSYIVVYSPRWETDIRHILGKEWNVEENYRSALEKSTHDIQISDSEINTLYALFNWGINLTGLGDFREAVRFFDMAWNVFESLPPDQRPERLFAYHPQYFQAYFEMERYEDIVRLANGVLETSDPPVTEESYLWRGLAKEALDDIDGAIVDLEIALQINPRLDDARDKLNLLLEGS
jgi:hypothetical protein